MRGGSPITAVDPQKTTGMITAVKTVGETLVESVTREEEAETITAAKTVGETGGEMVGETGQIETGGKPIKINTMIFGNKHLVKG